MSKFEANTARQAIDSIPPSLLRDDGRGKALTTGGTYWMPSFQSVLPKDRGRGGHVGRGDHHRETRVPRATPSQLQEARHLRGLVGDVDALERSLGRVERHASEMMQDLHTARSCTARSPRRFRWSSRSSAAAVVAVAAVAAAGVATGGDEGWTVGREGWIGRRLLQRQARVDWVAGGRNWRTLASGDEAVTCTCTCY